MKLSKKILFKVEKKILLNPANLHQNWAGVKSQPYIKIYKRNKKLFGAADIYKNCLNNRNIVYFQLNSLICKNVGCPESLFKHV